MKTTNKTLIALLALGASASLLMAQDAGGPPQGGDRPPRQDGPGGPGMRGQRPPPSPLMMVLDANHDGVIDADEIANASAALKTLDKNGDGKLTQDELRPPRPEGMGGPNGQQPDGNRPARRGGPGGPDGNQQPPPRND